AAPPMDDDREALPGAGRPGSRAAGGSGTEPFPLPPPAFPPGLRVPARSNHRHAPGPVGDAGGEEAGAAEGDVPPDAFISPDEPFVRTESHFEPDAFFFPEEEQGEYG